MNKRLFLTIIGAISLALFVLSEIFVTELVHLNTVITLSALLFLPVLLNNTFKLKFHFSLIYVFYFILFLVLSILSSLGILDNYILSSLARLVIVFGFFGTTAVHLAYSSYAKLPDLKDVLAIMTVAAVSLVIVFVGIRDVNSLVSPDILQHQAVVNQVFEENKVCALPSQCNNLFLKDGYTTLHHSLIYFLSPLEKDTDLRLYSLDIAWVFISAVAVFMFCKKYLKDNFLTAVTSLVALNVFINYAYPFSFFVPQTLALMIFILSFRKEGFTKVNLITLVIVLMLTHFIMGTFLALFLIVLFLIKQTNTSVKAVNFTLVLGVIFTTLLSIANITFEQVIQKDEIVFLGGTTNPQFPQNLVDLLNVGPIVIILFIVAAFLNFRKNEDEDISVLIAFVLLSFSAYLLGPTYAKKFLIGIGLWMAIVIVHYLKKFLETNTNRFNAALVVVVILSMFTFITNYNSYLVYFDTSNQVSVYKTKDQALVDYLNKTKLNCTLVSDPITQIIVTGLTKFETVQGQYMTTEYRQVIHSFLQNPDPAKLRQVLNFPQEEEICFVYSYRLEEARVERIDMWANQLYFYVVDSSKTLSSSIDPIKVLNDEMDLVYKDNYYYIFK